AVRLDILDQQSMRGAATADRDRQPLRTARRLHAIPVAPAVLVVLHVVVENEDIGTADEIEIAAPWDVRRLHDHASHANGSSAGTTGRESYRAPRTTTRPAASWTTRPSANQRRTWRNIGSRRA